ncbi:MAG: hypothetical protein IPG89_17865 [Bacteroidetes bacterium]|nr:hypothetical protein [Bacteroidota bacterium]
MKEKPYKLETKKKMDKKNIGQKILHFPLTKIIIGLIVCGGVVGVGQALIQKHWTYHIDKDLKSLIGGILSQYLL